MFELEETDENKAKLFAKEIGAVFKYTSAKNSIGVDVQYMIYYQELFDAIGTKFLIREESKNLYDDVNQSISIDKSKHKKKKEEKKNACC